MTHDITTQFKDGIYFNMPFETYFAQDRFSTSRVNGINDSVLSYWTDEIEPTLAEDYDLQAHVDETTESMEEGKAWHVMALEGREAFDKLYTSDYDPADHKDAIKSKDEHIAACKKHGVAFKESETIASLQAGLIAAGADVQFHSVLKAEHQAANAGKTLLSPAAMQELKTAGAVMKAYGIHESFLSDGFPEVSILFTMDGEKFKIRVDWLAATKQVEFKTLTLRSKKKHFETACADQMHDFGYFAGGYLYTRGVEIAREALSENVKDFAVVDMGGANIPQDWLEAFAGGKRHEYFYLFQQRGKHNHVLPRKFGKYDEVVQNRTIQRLWKTGEVDVRRAVKVYNEMMEKFGRENRWLPPLNPKAWSDEDFRPWQIEP